MNTEATKYAKAVDAGKVVAGSNVIAACKRHLDDLRESKKKGAVFVWDQGAADRVLAFAKLCHHYKGPLAGQAFNPDPWQCFILQSVIAWKRKDNGRRRYRIAYVEVARKNAKTYLAAVVALYLLALDGERGAEIYSAATKVKQAKIVWDMAEKIAKRSPALRDKFRTRYSALEYERTDSFFEPLPADSDKLDGLNPHGGIVDEFHAWPHRGLWDQLEDGMGARDQPLIFAITTAGHDKNGICYQVRQHCLNTLTLDGYDDDEVFSYVACPDEEDLADPEGWKKTDVWKKANPALGTAKKIEFMQSQVDRAGQMPSKENTVKTKQLNIWTAGETKWLDVARFEQCGRSALNYADAFESMTGRDCYTGLDLSAKVDFTAAAHLFPPTEDSEKWSVLLRLWVPEATAAIREKRDRIPLAKWVDEGFVTLTDGEVVDYDKVEADLIADGETFNVREIGFDPWNATATATHLDLEGFSMIQMRQGFATMAAPTKEFEVMTMRRQWEHFKNPALCWMAKNAQVVRDSNDNLRPAKNKAADRIDGVVAMIMALGRALLAEDSASIYETRGPLTL